MLLFCPFSLHQEVRSRDPVGHMLELKLKALILDTIHSIDVVQTLVHSSVKTETPQKW